MFKFAISCEKMLKFILKKHKKPQQNNFHVLTSAQNKQTNYNFNICIYAIVWMQKKKIPNSLSVSHFELIQGHIHNIVVWAIVVVSKLS